MQDLIKDLKGYSLGELWEKKAKVMKDNYDVIFSSEDTAAKTLTLETFFAEVQREYVKIDNLYYWKRTCEKMMEHFAEAFKITLHEQQL